MSKFGKGLVIVSESVTNTLKVQSHYRSWNPASVRFWADGLVTFGPAPQPPGGGQEQRGALASARPPAAGRSKGQRVWHINRRRVRAAAFALFQRSFSLRMYTFTFPSSWTNEQRHDSITRFARFLSKKGFYYGVSGYVWVIERHKSGLIHAHFLVGFQSNSRSKLFYSDLERASIRWTGSSNGLDSRWIRGGKRAVSAYVSKYVSKSKGVSFEFRAYGAGGVALNCCYRLLPDVPVRLPDDSLFYIYTRASGSYLSDSLQVPVSPVFALIPYSPSPPIPGLTFVPPS